MKGLVWGPGECIIQSHEIFKLFRLILCSYKYLCFDQTLAHGSAALLQSTVNTMDSSLAAAARPDEPHTRAFACGKDDCADPARRQWSGCHFVARLLVICSGERTRTPIHGIKTRCPAFERPRTVRNTVSGFLFSSLSR